MCSRGVLKQPLTFITLGFWVVPLFSSVHGVAGWKHPKTAPRPGVGGAVFFRVEVLENQFLDCQVLNYTPERLT